MRRYLVLEEASAPGELKSVFNNIENNGAPWQYSSEDRLNWAKEIGFEVPVISELSAKGINLNIFSGLVAPELLTTGIRRLSGLLPEYLTS